MSSPVPEPVTAPAEPVAVDAHEPAEIPDMPRGRVLRYAGGFLAFGLLWAIANSMVASVLLPQRLTDLGVDSPAAVLGTIYAVTAIVSLVSNLVAGNLSDRTRSRFGRRTPWIVAGGLLAGVTIALVGFIPDPTLLTVDYCLTMVGLNMMLAPAVAVIFDRVPFKARGTMSAGFGGGATGGYALGAIVGAAFISTPMVGYVLAGVAMALAGVVAVALWPKEGSAKAIPADDGGSLLDVVKSFSPPRHAPDFYKAFVGRLFMLLSYQMISAYQLYILQNYMGQSVAESAGTIAIASTITLVVGLTASLVGGPISDRLNRRKAPVIIASLLFAVGIAMPWILPSTTGFLLYALIAGFGYGVYGSVDQALNVDVLPRPKKAGEDLGILNLATTAGQTVGPMITSGIVVATGGYTAIFPVAIVAAVIGAAVIVWIRGVR